MTPTPGRVLWFYPGAEWPAIRTLGGPLAALVAAVHSPTMVNLAVFDAYGGTHACSSIPLIDPEDMGQSTMAAGAAHATWMPYQIGQARAQAAEAPAAPPAPKRGPLDPISGAEIERQLVANGAKAPRLTPDDIHAVITDESYCLLEGTTTTICYLTLENGFIVTGESACISPENFDQKIGCEVAYKQAIGKIWMLEGYLMKQRIYDAQQPRAVDPDHIARICHEVNRAYCAAIGDASQPAWADAPDWQRDSARAGVALHLENPHASASASHEAWMAHKVADGWVYGSIKDAGLKTHPCIVPFDELPREQQAKDYIFRAVVHAVSPPVENQAFPAIEFPAGAPGADNE